MAKKKTTVGTIADDVLAYTAGEDILLDQRLVRVDCIGTAAHVTMLSRMRVKPRIFSAADRRKVTAELARVVRSAEKGKFTITLADQDVHLAVERVLTKALGDLGKRVHTGRSRNDQVAVDLRLFGKEQLLGALEEGAALADVLLGLGRAHVDVPMVGRTHMQPAMPSSVGLWASAFAEGFLDDASGLVHAFEMNDHCPLGAAAGYGVPLPLDRQAVSDLLGFSRPVHNVLHATHTRGKVEGIILGALAQVMVTASRLAQDLILYTMPEFGYFELPEAFCTGSSIMPQKKNPDVLELVRAKTARVLALQHSVLENLRASPSGYNRDVQETKPALMEGLDLTRATLRILAALVADLKVHTVALKQAFRPEVFATDAALAHVARGQSFRDAYHKVKKELPALEGTDPAKALGRKRHMGAPAGLDFEHLGGRVAAVREFARDEQRLHETAASKLLGISYKL